MARRSVDQPMDRRIGRQMCAHASKFQFASTDSGSGGGARGDEAGLVGEDHELGAVTQVELEPGQGFEDILATLSKRLAAGAMSNDGDIGGRIETVQL